MLSFYKGAALYSIKYPSTVSSAALAQQISQVLVALKALGTASERVPPAVSEDLAFKFQPKVANDIALLADRFVVQLRSAAGLSDQWNDPAVRSDLASIQSATASYRRALSRQPDGRGLQSSIMASLGLAIELSCSARLGWNSNNVRILCDEYEAWLDSMETDTKGSISTLRFNAAMVHDGQLNTNLGSSLAGRLKLENFLLAGGQKGPEIADPCVIFTRPGYIWPSDVYGGFVLNDSAINGIRRTAATNVAVGRGRIEVKEDRNLGIHELVYPESRGLGQSSSPHFLFSPERVGDYCYAERSTVTLTPDQVRDKVAENMIVKSDAVDRTAIKAAIDTVNQMRATIALCGDGLLLVHALKQCLAYQRRLL
jgi:hypothetical protein